MRNLTLRLPSAPRGFRDRFVRTLDVFIDPTDGRVFRVRSRWPPKESPIAPEPSAEFATTQLKSSGLEVYHGFPTEIPAVTFLDALDRIQGVGRNPLIAKQIIGNYVTWSRGPTEPNLHWGMKEPGRWSRPRPVWAITLRGIPASRPRPEWPKDARYSFRYIVDARTGEVIMGTNIPHSDKPHPDEG